MRKPILIGLLMVGSCAVAAFVPKSAWLRMLPDLYAGKVPVMYATTAIRRGDTLRIDGNIRFAWVAESKIPADAFLKEERVLREMKRRQFIAFEAIGENEIVRRGKAGNPPTGGCGDLPVDRTLRPCSVTVATDGSAERGLIEPGSLVDLNWNAGVGRTQKNVLNILHEEVQVLAIKPATIVDPGLMGRNAYMMTLGLTSGQIGTIQFALEHGTLSAVLHRSQGHK